MTPTRITWETLGLPLVAHLWEPEATTPTTRTVVLLHGFLDHGLAFRAVAEHLAFGHRVIAPDHRGHGESGRVGAGGYYHFPDYILDLDGLFEAASLDRAVVVGHSMGASIGVYFTGSFPERVEGLVLLDGIGPPHSDLGRGPRRIQRWISDVRRQHGRAEREGAPFEDMVARIIRASPHVSPEHAAAIAATATAPLPSGGYRWRFDPLHRSAAPTPFDAERFKVFIAAIACPALLLWAEKTPFRPEDEAIRMACLRQSREQTLADTSHNMHYERPVQVAELVAEFIEKDLAGAAPQVD